MPEHKYALEAVGNRSAIVCACGWRSEPMHLINTDAAWRKHISPPTEVNTHDHTREHAGTNVRVACSCGFRGQWRWAGHPLIEKQLHSDDGGHLYAVRRDAS